MIAAFIAMSLVVVFPQVVIVRPMGWGDARRSLSGPVGPGLS
jgi:hypothetical protein